MPFIRITILSPNAVPEQIRRLQQGTTALMVSVMRKPVDGIAVLVEQLPHGHWSIAGPLVGVAAHVEATIAQGSNTPDEKARFHEVERNAYGRGGARQPA